MTPILGETPTCSTTDVVLREVDATDGAVLREVFAGLSAESRYLRYLTAMPTLPAQVQRILNAVDGCCHVAVAAFVEDKPVGLARLIDLGGHRAELAVEVVDARQGQGIGELLVRWVRDRAPGLGYTELVAATSAGNARAQALAREVFPDFTARREGTLIVHTLPVGSIHPTAA